MPGVHCSVLGCGSCRRSKGIGIFELPVAKDEAHQKLVKDTIQNLIVNQELPDTSTNASSTPLELRAFTSCLKFTNLTTQVVLSFLPVVAPPNSFLAT